jgi:hypothetical protein
VKSKLAPVEPTSGAEHSSVDQSRRGSRSREARGHEEHEAHVLDARLSLGGRDPGEQTPHAS